MARLWMTLVVAVVSLSTPLVGHHSFAEFYLEEDTIEVEGQILEVQYKNPHSWIHVQGEDPFKRPKVYSVEWASVSRLERDGITKRTLREGDWVRIWASPNRNPNDNRVRLKRIERRGDHWSWGASRTETR
jgi:Family of unknown function (DUF6152)